MRIPSFLSLIWFLILKFTSNFIQNISGFFIFIFFKFFDDFFPIKIFMWNFCHDLNDFIFFRSAIHKFMNFFMKILLKKKKLNFWRELKVYFNLLEWINNLYLSFQFYNLQTSESTKKRSHRLPIINPETQKEVEVDKVDNKNSSGSNPHSSALKIEAPSSSTSMSSQVPNQNQQQIQQVSTIIEENFHTNKFVFFLYYCWNGQLFNLRNRNHQMNRHVI